VVYDETEADIDSTNDFITDNYGMGHGERRKLMDLILDETETASWRVL
jgi:hypothetical protein